MLVMCFAPCHAPKPHRYMKTLRTKKKKKKKKNHHTSVQDPNKLNLVKIINYIEYSLKKKKKQKLTVRH